MAVGVDEASRYQSLADADSPVILSIGPVARFQHGCTAIEPLVQALVGLPHAPLAQLGQGRQDEENLLRMGFTDPFNQHVGTHRQGTPAVFDRVTHKLSTDVETAVVGRLVSMITFQSQ